MSLNDSLSEIERAKLAVWDYPVSDKYTKIWQAMNEADFPQDLDSAVKRVQESNDTHGFAFIGMFLINIYPFITTIFLKFKFKNFRRCNGHSVSCSNKL